MLLSYIMLIVALCLSAVAAFYSIVGLTAIFAAAVIPIILMGSILEVAKVTVTIWLHEYWAKCRLAMKLYLVPAVGALMVITSMGIFGFLSKAHSDQSLVSGDSLAKIAIYDEKIQTSRDNIETNRKALKQMDEAVDQIMGRSDDEKGADKAVAVRRAQQKERQRLLAEIAAEQKVITQLNQEAAPLRAENRKIEAEVGPIKYIAALIYGDNPDANLLERAVRWVIIVIVAVFDPLAIMMLLAATESFKWERAARIERRVQDELHAVAVNPITVPDTLPDPPETPVEEPKAQEQLEEDEPWPFPMVRPVEGNARISVGYPSDNTKEPVNDEKPPEETHANESPAVAVETLEEIDEHIQDPDSTETATSDIESDAEKAAMREWKISHPESTIKEQRRLADLGVIPTVPWQNSVAIKADNEPVNGNVTGFGIQFPDQPNKGDVYLRVDMLPTVLYKYNGKKWIEIDKDLTDTYVWEEAYIDFLIARLESGEYDAELLTYSEREQIATRLQKNS